MSQRRFARSGFTLGVVALLLSACGSSPAPSSSQSAPNSATATSSLGVGVYGSSPVPELCPGSNLDATKVSTKVLSGGGIRMNYSVQKDALAIGITCSVGFKVSQWTLQKGGSSTLWSKGNQHAIFSTAGSAVPIKLSVCSWSKPQSHYSCPN